ncbi:MAG: serine hydrolase [Robiginitomaculum sp.]|nr:serine hydrolase [Robiginitomaculum sp.]
MKFFVLITILFFCTNAVFAKEDFSAIDDYVEQVKKGTDMPSGTAIAIVKNGKIIYEGYFGFADIQAKKPVDADTAFYIASTTKPFFALSMLLMEHKGDIKDTTTMAEMFPDIKFRRFKPKKVQLQNLMSHTAGIKNPLFVANLAYFGLHDKARRRKSVAAIVSRNKGKLGKFVYTNLGYNVASVWVEDTYKQDWQKTLAELVFDPLNMSSTSAYMSEIKMKGIEVALPYSFFSENPKEALSFQKKDSTMHAAGGMVSTARDVARFLIAELNNGMVDGKQVFPRAVIEKSQQQLATNNSKYRKYRDFGRDGYAWGWFIGPYKDQVMLHHFGDIAGTHAHLSFIPKRNIGLVILNNESWVSDAMANTIADIAYSILLDKGDPDALVKPRVQSLVSGVTKVLQNKANEKEPVEEMNLSLDKPSYAGTFYNPLIGNVRVELIGADQYKFTLGELDAMATGHKDRNAMHVVFVPKVRTFVPDVSVRYVIKRGKVTGFRMYQAFFEKLK